MACSCACLLLAGVSDVYGLRLAWWFIPAMLITGSVCQVVAYVHDPDVADWHASIIMSVIMAVFVSYSILVALAWQAACAPWT